MSDEFDLLLRQFDRERAARKAAEAALEQKSGELYDAVDQLRLANCRLTGEVAGEQTARRASEATAAAIVDAALDAVIAVDSAGVVLAWNRQAARLFGYPAGDAVGRPLAELVVPPQDRAAFDRLRADVVPPADGDACVRQWLDQRVQATAVDRAGRRFPVEVAVTALPPTTAGGGTTFSAFVRDARQVRQSERRRRILYDVSAALAEAADVAAAFPAVLAAIGQGLEADVGFAWEMSPADRLLRPTADWAPAQAGDGTGHAAMRADTLRRAYGIGVGVPGRVWETSAPAWVGDIARDDNFPRQAAAAAASLRSVVGFPVLVDERVAATMEFFHRDTGDPDPDLLALMSAVGRQVGQFVRRRRAEADAAAAQVRAEAASRAKSDFLANMSHEIRTPLNGVVGMLQLLTGTELTADQRRHAAVAEASAAALLTLINDILDFSKVEAGKLELDAVPFDLADVAAASVAIVQPRADAKGLPLSCALDPSVACRRVGAGDRVRQVLVNLLGNAVKFTAAGSVTLAITSDGDDRVRFAVTDTGIGIPPDRLDRLFQSFSQVDASTTRQYGGTGLGLAISRQLAGLMGGTVGVDSAVGRGSTFWFTARLAVDTAAPVVAGPVPEVMPTVPAGRRILVAEDNEVNQMVVGEMLRRMGYQLQLVEDGRAAVVAAAGGGFDVVLMDCQMPTMDGFEAATAIRTAEAVTGRRVPIIALTANALKGDRERCLAAGMDDYMSKPVDAAQLSAKLAHWLAPARRAA